MFHNKVALFDLIIIKLQRFRLCGGDQGFPVALDLRMRKLRQGYKTHEACVRPGPSDAYFGENQKKSVISPRWTDYALSVPYLN